MSTFKPVNSAFSITVILALSLTSVAYAGPLGSQFSKDKSPPVLFDQSKTFIAPENLPIKDNGDRLSEKAGGQPIKAVAVTPAGESYSAEISAEDLQIFENAVSQMSESFSGRRQSNKQPKAGKNGIAPERASNEGQANAESVIGTDERVRVFSTTTYPWRTMGRIDIGCTGTLIGPRHVLTAGHCVYNISNNQWFSNLNFTPAQNGNTKPYGTITWSSAITTTGWTVNKDRNHDYAMIILSSRIGNTVGWLGYGYDNNLPKYVVNINGYPADKPFGTMWHSDCTLALIQTYRLYYPCDTSGGMSGSGVYAYFPSTNSRIIYGVHAYGVDSTGYNGATRITQTVFNNLGNWIAANP